jgi:hypothetical protein
MAALKQLFSSDFKINCSGITASLQSLLDTRMPEKRPNTCTSFGKLKNMLTLALIKHEQLFFFK